MSRLASFLTALWLSSAAAHPGFLDVISSGAKSVKDIAFNEAQAAGDPLGKSIALIGGSVCPGVKRVLGVNYESYEGNEPDMSQLTLVYINSAKTVQYKLAEAAVEIPKERWWNRKLVIYLHGFTDNPMKSSFQSMLAAYKSKDEDISILALDASSLIQIFYLRASTVVRFIGTSLGTIIAALTSAGLELKNVHLLGHSLGSHIAGFAGKAVVNQTGSHVGRITGLDPASPCFAKFDAESDRLSMYDADFVDIIHTDAGVYGMDHSIGHVDFYVNGGSEQPGCLLQTCSHSRAWEYYAESVLNPEGYQAVRCNSYYDFRNGACDHNDTSVMGYATPNTTRGEYYLLTHAEEPYYAGIEGLSYQNNGIIRTAKLEVSDLIQGILL